MAKSQNRECLEELKKYEKEGYRIVNISYPCNLDYKKTSKLIMRDIQADDILLERTLPLEKAIALKQVLDLYIDSTKLEVKIIEEEGV